MRMTDEQRVRIAELSAQGMKQAEIAREIGTTQATVSRVLSRLDKPSKPSKPSEPAKHATLTAEQQADLMELVAEGYGLAELAPDFGCDAETLEYYVRKHQRAENRAKEREDRIVCGDKFSGLLLDQGNGDFHGTWKNADGTFEHMNLHGYTRETAKECYERWRQEKAEADKTYQAVFDKPKGKRVWVVSRTDASCALLESEDAANELAEQITALTGVKMAVREVVV